MGFFCLEDVTAIFLMVHLKGSAYWGKEDGAILDVCGATLIKIAFFTQAAAVTEILFLEQHLRLFKYHGSFDAFRTFAGPACIAIPLASQNQDGRAC